MEVYIGIWVGFTSAIYETVYSSSVSVLVELRPCTLSMATTARSMVVEDGIRKVLRGDVGTFYGYLRDKLTGAGLAEKTIILRKNTTEVSRGITATNGYFRIGYNFPTEAEAVSYGYSVHFPGDDVYGELDSPSMAIMAEARVPTITFTISPTTTTVGATLGWSGYLYDPKISTLKIPEATVYLQRDGIDTTDTGITRTDGRYYGTTKAPALPGNYVYRARYPGGAVTFGLYDGAVSMFEAVTAGLPPIEVLWILMVAPLVIGTIMTLSGTFKK